MLGGDDLAEAARVLAPGSAAVLMIYENTWAAPLTRALRRGGAHVVAAGRIPVQEVMSALDATERSATAATGRG
jgi:hypothetical protein